MTSETDTVIVFRVWKEKGGTVFALMPYEKWDNRGHVASYERIGQHGGAHYAGCIARSRPATVKEYIRCACSGRMGGIIGRDSNVLNGI